MNRSLWVVCLLVISACESSSGPGAIDRDLSRPVDSSRADDLQAEPDLVAPECVVDTDCTSRRSCCANQCVDVHVDTTNCGACGTVCKAGEACCDDACVPDPMSNILHCGGCATVCPVPANATPGCARGRCGVGMCNAGFADCDGDGRTGCEVDLRVDVKSCGACGKECPAMPHAKAQCTAGQCGKTCDPGFQDCNGQPADGCEVSVATDLNNCGACGVVCPVPPNAKPACAGGVCSLDSCNFPFLNCDGNLQNGCEVDSSSDVKNCGACSVGCAAFPNASPACKAGVCGLGLCNANFANCDFNLVNGCETNLLTDTLNCGACGKACAARPNAVAACVLGACDLGPCVGSFYDCNKVPADGCESNVNTDPSNCGACGKPCPAVANGKPGCAMGVCGVGSCDAGFADCNKNAGDGCEVNLTNAPANCGACGKVCTVPNGVAGCANSLCTVASCNVGFGDCNKIANDGCEAAFGSDPNNCGGCAVVCASGVCSGGKCLYAPVGVQTAIPVATVTGGNWTQCYLDTYNGVLPFATITAVNCTKARLMMACRATGAATLDALAWAPRADVLFPIGANANSVTPHNANGVGWYADAGWSWGFAPQGAAISHFTCDTVSNSDNDKRLCWDTSGAVGGYRCGVNAKLNNSAAFERIVYQAD